MEVPVYEIPLVLYTLFGEKDKASYPIPLTTNEANAQARAQNKSFPQFPVVQFSRLYKLPKNATNCVKVGGKKGRERLFDYTRPDLTNCETCSYCHRCPLGQILTGYSGQPLLEAIMKYGNTEPNIAEIVKSWPSTIIVTPPKNP